MDYFDSIDATKFSELNIDVLQDLVEHLKITRNLGGIKCAFRLLSAFFNWWKVNTHNFDWQNPIQFVQLPRVNIEPISGVTIEEVQKMLANYGKTSLRRRDRVVITLLFDTGARASEFINIKLHDVAMEHGRRFIDKGKGGKSRYVYFVHRASNELDHYLRITRLHSDGPLFPNEYGQVMSRWTLSQILERRAKGANLPEIPSPNDFRRGCALTLLRNGVDVVSVSRMLGHSDVRVTMRYLALVSDDLEKAYRFGSPMDRIRR